MRLIRLRRSIGDFIFRWYPPEVLERLADDWLVENRVEDALGAYTLADAKYTSRRGRIDPLAVGVRARRAWCLAQLGRRPEAMELYRDALAAKRQSADDQPPTAQMLSEQLHGLTAQPESTFVK